MANGARSVLRIVSRSLTLTLTLTLFLFQQPQSRCLIPLTLSLFNQPKNHLPPYLVADEKPYILTINLNTPPILDD
jgi:hypothetical protein